MRAIVAILLLFSPALSDAAPGNVLVVVPDEHGIEVVTGIHASLKPILRRDLSPQALEDHAAAGGSFLWIGSPQDLPATLWMGSFQPAHTKLRVTPAEGAPIPSPGSASPSSRVWSGFLKPTKELAYHNVVEEPRANLIPLLEARDRFGEVIGYPGVLLRHYAPSLAANRFNGSDQYYFFFEEPWTAFSVSDWRSILQAIARRIDAGVQLTRVKAEWASYRIGEPVRLQASIANRRARAAAVSVRFLIKEPGQKDFRPIAELRRTPTAGGEILATASFKPQAAGSFHIRVELRQDPQASEALSQAGNPTSVDQQDSAVLIHDGVLRTTPTVSTSGLNITLDGSESFWIGTHYYPSSSWWDGAWRDFRPLLVDRDFAAMRRIGYRIVRIWIDPTLDQESMRAMDAAILLAAKHGLVLDICLFTQWGPGIAYEKDNGELASIALRDGKDFNVYGISFRHLSAQKEYVRKLAHRWKNARNIVFNLANETYIRDPDRSQMDPEVGRWAEALSPPSPDRDVRLFRRWARELTDVIRKAGSAQPVIPGYLFSSMGGGDGYLGNRDADISVWHSYMSPEDTAATVSYLDTACSNRPLMLEEFGRGSWNSAEHYDQVIHYALGAGASAAMSYEWGVSWMSPELPPHPTFLNFPWPDNPDLRWFSALKTVATDWPATSPGFFPAASGFPYGSVYHGTPFPAEAAMLIGRLSGFGSFFARRPSRAATVVRVPVADHRDRMSELFPLLKLLWARHMPYAVAQSDCVAPAAIPLSKESLNQAAGQQVEVSPRTLKLMVRESKAGTLYSLFGDNSATAGTVRVGGDTISMAVRQNALLLRGAKGIVLAESEGALTINNQSVFSSERGAVLAASEDDEPISTSKQWRLRASEPTGVTFSRPIRSAHAVVGPNQRLVSLETSGTNTLIIDTELYRYDLQLRF